MPDHDRPLSSYEDLESSVIRTEMRTHDVQLRGTDFPAARLREIKKGLLALDALETMATAIYRSQIRHGGSEVDRQLLAGMLNEMTHRQDFEVKLYEYGCRPGMTRHVYWVIGWALGTFSRLFGQSVMLKADIWFERRAVRHYSKLLGSIAWDHDTRRVLEKDRADEYEHINRWRHLLQSW